MLKLFLHLCKFGLSSEADFFNTDTRAPTWTEHAHVDTGNSALQNSSCTATYLSSQKGEQDMLSIAIEVRTNS